MSVWLSGVYMSDDEVETALIAVLIRPSCRSTYEGLQRVLKNNVHHFLQHNVMPKFADADAFWQLLHTMMQSKSRLRNPPLEYSHPDYERWLNRNYTRTKFSPVTTTTYSTVTYIDWNDTFDFANDLPCNIVLDKRTKT